MSQSPSPPVSQSTIRFFVRVTNVSNPIPVDVDSSLSVSESKSVFLHRYVEAIDKAGGSRQPVERYTCRLVCRGHELTDDKPLSDSVRPGDHVHAIVREMTEDEEQQAEARRRSTSIREEAQHWVREVRRFLEQRRSQNQNQEQNGGTGDVNPTADGGSSSIGAGSQTAAMTEAQRRAAEMASPTPEHEHGGQDGLSDIVVDQPAVELTSIQSLNQIAEHPLKVFSGFIFGYFSGFAAMIFMFAKTELSFEVRFGVGVGLAVNVLLAWMLPAPTLVSVR